MILCDIGNTSYHFLDEQKDYKKDVETFNALSVDEKVYYISVNSNVNAVLEKLDNWIDLSQFIDRKKYYETMGIDRIFAVEAVTNTVIVDAGSAITVDVVKYGNFEGGFIYPGVDAMRQTYKNISPALDYSFNFDLDLDIMPKNSQDAISYGFLKTLYSEVMHHELPVVLTGGNAKELHKIFKNASLNETLIFDGMKQIIKKAILC
ncbi:type III pantothenate kinase [Sulfurimonas sp. SAG-AH-194-C20]|nr:type III pantothenate kinase [Sulfurimonas sp. SAG-AH-194-C20]MDF1879017.1 type III pantothenate kinase [Sulfurimonas sp. SAG-AH-194-C20]